ncbi:AmiS/UreI family transporter [Exiguobacterium sp. AT1b]|uniref:AmiS/UreI family transporter n=1 Tax=Exiguobacterium sp. (strain ATCC BAA-1283 / AT1b) TaxID=360911 RepID=UPI00093D949A|nr:AmiS/UreI family transporter [Exiguobacterium sp. AT1b]
MGNVSLLFGGVALFLNSLVLLGKVDMKSAGVFSLFTGILQTFIATWLLIGASPEEQFGLASIYLFAFTYLYVGVTFILNLDGRGVGWFSLFVSIAAAFYGVMAIAVADPMGALTWFFWSLLWGLFFFGMGLGKANEAITARVALVLSWLTLIVPAMVGMAGLMNALYDMIWWAASGIAILYFIVSVKRTKQAVEVA